MNTDDVTTISHSTLEMKKVQLPEMNLPQVLRRGGGRAGFPQGARSAGCHTPLQVVHLVCVQADGSRERGTGLCVLISSRR